MNPSGFKYSLSKVLVSRERLQLRVKELASEILRSEVPDILVGVLTGAFPFVADLSRELALPEMEVRFVKASSYGCGTEHAALRVQGLESLDVSGRKVLLVDDILDSGWTLSELSKAISAKGAASVKTCVLLDKPERREVPLSADFSGFPIENEFVVGYGLDYAEKFRSLPEIHLLKLGNV